ncbi:hypothetical protein CRG98_012543 [Punica granatum]|uniref:Uncharacterized protein n=1 Tax=Punica granatum TaxID=22663 RepID=A0A2I0KES8_PUNGR|nr:hypothetical protein CRG98_012543 [Punica granatum]
MVWPNEWDPIRSIATNENLSKSTIEAAQLIPSRPVQITRPEEEEGEDRGQVPYRSHCLGGLRYSVARPNDKVLYGRYEVMNGLLYNVAKLNKANDNKDRFAKEAETSHQATEAELGQLKEHITELEGEVKELKRECEKRQ